jgi:hypothetical protein
MRNGRSFFEFSFTAPRRLSLLIALAISSTPLLVFCGGAMALDRVELDQKMDRFHMMDTFADEVRSNLKRVDRDNSTCKDDKAKAAIEWLEWEKNYIGNLVAPAGGLDAQILESLSENLSSSLAKLKALPPCKLKPRITRPGKTKIPRLHRHPPREPQERKEIGDARMGGAGTQLAGCSSGCLTELPSGLSLEATAFTGGTFATSFGSDYDTSVFGGRFAAAFQLPQNVRFQIDFEGEGSGAYCTTCGSHDYFASAAHADWSALPNFEFGAFGGAQYARPTFGAPTSTNGFGGVEFRVFAPNTVFGGNAGYFDVSSGPGTLKNAWFAEGRAKFELAYVFGAGKLRGPTLELGGGYASGNLSGFLNNSASSAQWHATLAAPILDMPVQGFLKYVGHTNRVDGLGTVWTGHAVVGGVQINLGCQCEKSLEPMMPLPFVLQTVTTF